MSGEQALFPLAGPLEPNLELIGGLRVAADETFSTATRIRRDETVIPVLSLGAARRFLIRPAGGGPSKTILAHGGDLVVMGGRCQKDYQHSVPKQKQAAGPRLSLNFSAPVASA